MGPIPIRFVIASPMRRRRLELLAALGAKVLEHFGSCGFVEIAWLS